MSSVNPFILRSKGQGQEPQKRCWRGSLHSYDYMSAGFFYFHTVIAAACIC